LGREKHLWLETPPLLGKKFNGPFILCPPYTSSLDDRIP
jgi:hypothetical protein